MKKFIFFIVATVFLGLSANIFASRLTVINVDKPILVKKNTRIISIELPANPSTGYSWFLTHYNHYLLEPISQKFVPSRKQVAGAAGLSIWKFRVNRLAFRVPQIIKLALQYRRPWVKNDEKSAKNQVITLITQ